MPTQNVSNSFSSHVVQTLTPKGVDKGFVALHEMSICPGCGLHVVLGSRCMLCEEEVSDVVGIVSQKVQASDPISTITPCAHHAVGHPSRSSAETQGDGGRSSPSVDLSPDQGKDCRTEGRHAKWQSLESDAKLSGCSQAGFPKESRHRAVCQGPSSRSGCQRDHSADLHQTGEDDLGLLSSLQCRNSRFRAVLPQDIRGNLRRIPKLCGMVQDHLPGRSGVLEDAEVSQMDRDPRIRTEGQEWQRKRIERLQDHVQSGTKDQDEGSRVLSFVGHLLPGEPCRVRESHKDEGGARATSPGEDGVGTGECRDVKESGSCEDSSGDMNDSDEDEAPGKVTFFSDKDKSLFKHWLPGKCPNSKVWLDLIHHKRPLLLEVACSEQSILGQEVQSRFGENQHLRCSIWNGCDLTKPSGVEACKSVIRSERPRNIWISCDCGPFSPLQHVNQRNEQQAQNLEEKRRYAIQQYRGAIQVAKYGRKFGCEIHWELSERCEAWNLQFIQEFVDDLHMDKVTCNGCRVDLRARDSKELLCKGWTIATTSPSMCHHLNLPCQKNHPKGKCDRGRAKHTAFYTSVFAKRVIDAMLAAEDWNAVAKELCFGSGHVESKEVGEVLEQHCFAVSKEEKERILRNLKHIHTVTGHCSNHHLVDALRRRGVAGEVLDLARNFQCPICDEMKKPDARLPATLEYVPKKWQVVQTDVADWRHPEHDTNHKFVIFVDEGTRYRTGQILPGKGAPFADLKKAFDAHWIQHHGKPEILRFDPCGAWRSKAAEEFLANENIEPGEIPAEAHWRIGLVEVSIRIVKDIMTALAKEYPQKPVDELFAKAIWACNSRTTYNGFSPLQHATGRSPDEWGRLHQSKIDGIPIYAQQHADGGFEDMQKMMVVAETEFLKSQAKQRISRAMQAGSRKQDFYSPGDLVYYWRFQTGKQDGPQQFRRGKFVGPARVLAVETKQTDQGLEARDVIWLHRNGRLLKATTAQLRPASSREIAFEELRGPLQVPWNISSICKEPSKHMYEDISHEEPQQEDYEMSWDDQPPLRRHTYKRPADRPVDRQEASKRINQEDEDLQANEQAQHCFWGEEFNMVQLEISLPDSNRGMKTFFRDPVAFVVSNLKKKQVEVRENTLKPEEREEFRASKDKEVRNFVRECCLEVLPKH